MSPPDSLGLSKASGSESDVSQAYRGSGSLETSKGKPLVCQYALNLCLEVGDAIVDSLGLLVKLSVAEELGVEPPVEGGIRGCADGMERGRGAGEAVEEPAVDALGWGVVGDIEASEELDGIGLIPGPVVLGVEERSPVGEASDPFGQLAGVSSAGKGGVREVSHVNAEPDW